MVTIGVIGCGRIAQRHVDAYKRILGVRVVVADVDPSAAERLAEAMSVPWVKDPAELIDSREIDGIDGCVPTAYHGEVIIQALRAGKHVFCEKPLCPDLETARRIEAEAEQAGRMVMVGYLYRFHPAFQFVKQVLEDGIIGKPYFALFRLGGRGSHRPWKHAKAQGGGAIMEMFVHKLDLMLWFFGPVTLAESLYQNTILRRRIVEGQSIAADAEDCIVAHLEAGGVEIICQSDLITPSYMDYLEVQGSNGSIFSSILHYLPTIIYTQQPRGVFNLGNNLFTFPAVNLFEKELAHFVEAIAGRQETVNGIEDSIRGLEVIEQLRGKRLD